MIEVKGINKTFINEGREPLHVLKDVSFSVKKQEFICIIGSSGCGKTTLLNIMGGFVAPTSGEVIIEGVSIKKPSPRYISIFQDYKLLPWRTVRKNIELGFEAKNHNLSKQEITKIIDAQLDSVGLTGFDDFRPTEISGGMKQRVAIARALVLEPAILFMDEPFGALDALTRDDLHNKFRALLKRSGQTVVMVTHNLNEAIFFADRIIVMKPNPGRIESIIDINLPGERSNFTDDFLKVRDEIFSCLNT